MSVSNNGRKSLSGFFQPLENQRLSTSCDIVGNSFTTVGGIVLSPVGAPSSISLGNSAGLISLASTVLSVGSPTTTRTNLYTPSVAGVLTLFNELNAQGIGTHVIDRLQLSRAGSDVQLQTSNGGYLRTATSTPFYFGGSVVSDNQGFGSSATALRLRTGMSGGSGDILFEFGTAQEIARFTGSVGGSALVPGAYALDLGTNSKPIRYGVIDTVNALEPRAGVTRVAWKFGSSTSGGGPYTMPNPIVLVTVNVAGVNYYLPAYANLTGSVLS